MIIDQLKYCYMKGVDEFWLNNVNNKKALFFL